MADRREKVDVVTDCLFLGSKITMDSDCSHEIRRQLLLVRKARTNLDSVLRSRDITLPTKVIWLWELDCKEGRRPKNWYLLYLWWWRRLWRVSWTAGKSNQSILREINPEYSLEGLMLKLKLQYFGHLTWRADSTGKDSDAGKDWGQEKKGTTEDEVVGWHHQLNGHNSRR